MEALNHEDSPMIETRGLTMRYGARLIQKDLNLKIHQGDIFIIMGGSGCGKSTLLKHLIGLYPPAEGDILYHGESYITADDQARQQMRQHWGITFQSGALFSDMTLAENVALPLRHAGVHRRDIREIVHYKLSLVGLGGYEEYYPSQISGGMCKRAGLARAIALDPDILFFDEPSAGLDPPSARRLDDLILHLRDSTGATVVIVTHELASIFAIANNGIFLDTATKTALDHGDPRYLKEHSHEAVVRSFLARGESEGSQL